jgi:hypothetical protein
MLDALTRSDYDNYGAAAALYGTSPDTFRNTLLENSIDPEFMLGFFNGAVAAINGPGSGGTNDINVSISGSSVTPGVDIFFNNFQEGSGFSGVYDPVTGHFIIHPSGDTLLNDGTVPVDLVSQYGGHAEINQQLANQGIDPSGTVGFTVFYDGPGQLSVSWNSGSVNSVNFGNRAAPIEYRQGIIDALHNSTGYTVISR